MTDRNDDDKIQPLYVEQADMKGQLKMHSLRLDVVLQEVSELKSETKLSLNELRRDVKEDVNDIKTQINQVSEENKANVNRIEKWIVSMVGLVFTAVVGFGSVIIGRML